jgi:hypothetical protein
MKRLMLFCLVSAFVMTSTVISAQEKAPLGKGNFAVKLDYISFTDGQPGDKEADSDGLYLGLEGYFEVTRNLYLGGEVGVASDLGVAYAKIIGEALLLTPILELPGVDEVPGIESIEEFVPVEINLKYAMEPASNFVVDFGAGLSCSYVELHHFVYFFDPERENTITNRSETRDDWLFGGQVFVDLTYKIRWFSIGVNGKYQITQDFKDADYDLSNWRLGAQLGIVF